MDINVGNPFSAFYLINKIIKANHFSRTSFTSLNKFMCLYNWFSECCQFLFYSEDIISTEASLVYFFRKVTSRTTFTLLLKLSLEEAAMAAPPAVNTFDKSTITRMRAVLQLLVKGNTKKFLNI